MGIRCRAGRATGGQRCKISLATARWNPCAARSPLFVLSRAGDYSLRPRCGTTERCKRFPCNNPQTTARRQKEVRIARSLSRPETGPRRTGESSAVSALRVADRTPVDVVKLDHRWFVLFVMIEACGTDYVRATFSHKGRRKGAR